MARGPYLERCNVDDLLPRVLSKDPQHGELCYNGLARPCGSTQQCILVGVVQSVEGLGLDGVEVGELVQGLKGGFIKG